MKELSQNKICYWKFPEGVYGFKTSCGVQYYRWEKIGQNIIKECPNCKRDVRYKTEQDNRWTT